MQLKRLLFSVAVLIAMGANGIQAQSLFVRENGGTQTVYSLNDIIKISFPPGKISLFRTDGGSSTYPLPELRNLNYMQVTSVVQKPLRKKSSETLELFPNPAQDRLTLKLSSTLTSTGQIEIYSIEGKLVHSQEFNASNSDHMIDISSLPKGIYLCKIGYGPVSETARFIRQ